MVGHRLTRDRSTNELQAHEFWWTLRESRPLLLLARQARNLFLPGPVSVVESALVPTSEVGRRRLLPDPLEVGLDLRSRTNPSDGLVELRDDFVVPRRVNLSVTVTADPRDLAVLLRMVLPRLRNEVMAVQLASVPFAKLALSRLHIQYGNLVDSTGVEPAHPHGGWRRHASSWSLPTGSSPNYGGCAGNCTRTSSLRTRQTPVNPTHP